MSRKTSRTEVRAIPMRRIVCRRCGGSKLRRRRTRIRGENRSLLPRAQALGGETCFSKSSVPESAQKGVSEPEKLDVMFTMKPTTTDWGTLAVFDDSGGNLLNLHQG